VSHRYSRTVYDLGRIPDGRKVGNFHVPTNLEGYRHVYRAHIDDPDIQDARAHFPFVCIGDNHEFSWLRMAELHQIRQQDRTRAAAARRRQSGVVGIYPVARPQGLGPRA